MNRKEFITFADLPPNPLDQDALKTYKELGMNVCILTEDNVPFTKDGKITQEYRQAIENIGKAGMKVLVRNMFNDEDYFQNKEGEKYRSNYRTPYKIETRNITNEFLDRDEIFGFYMADEPYMKTLSKDMPFAYRHADRELFASFDKLQKLVDWKNAYYPNLFWHVNHVPSLSYDHYYPDGDTIYTYQDFIQNYIDTVLEKLPTGGRSLCVDNYPFIGEGYMEYDYLFDLITVANLTRDYNAKKNKNMQAIFGICLQAFHARSMSGDGRHRDICESEEISMQAFTGAALGARMFEYFCYRSYEDMDGIIGKNGEKRIYHLVKEANERVLPFAQYVYDYTWRGAYAVAGKTICDNARAFILAKNLFIAPSVDIYGDYDLLVGEFARGKEKAYMLVNFTDPMKKRTGVVKASFKKPIIYFYEGALHESQEGDLELRLAYGSAVFVMERV